MWTAVYTLLSGALRIISVQTYPPGVITLDISQSLVKEIDAIREAIGVDRGALIKVWLYDRVRQEKADKNRLG